MSKVKVKCLACEEVSNKDEWTKAEIKDGEFVGGCPNCAGEFYEEVE